MSQVPDPSVPALDGFEDPLAEFDPSHGQADLLAAQVAQELDDPLDDTDSDVWSVLQEARDQGRIMIWNPELAGDLVHYAMIREHLTLRRAARLAFVMAETHGTPETARALLAARGCTPEQHTNGWGLDPATLAARLRAALV